MSFIPFDSMVLLKERIPQMAEEERKQLRISKQEGKLHGWDRLCINFLIESILEPQNISINSVRAAFSEGKPLFDNSGLYDLAHVQIAIRNLNVIQNTWIYRQ